MKTARRRASAPPPPPAITEIRPIVPDLDFDGDPLPADLEPIQLPRLDGWQLLAGDEPRGAA